MAFPGKLLSLSIKTQIIWTMSIFSFISVVLIYVVINLYIYEMKEENLRNNIEYYYTMQYQILQDIISFQNFFLFNYEDILKILVCQLVLHVEIYKYFIKTDSLNTSSFSFQKINISNISQSKYIDNNGSQFTISFVKDRFILNSNEDDNENYLKMTFKMINAFKSFRMPYYGDNQLFDGIIVYLNKTKKIYSSNNTFLYEFVNNEIGSDLINEYYINLSNNITNLLDMSLEKILEDKTIIPELTLGEEIKDLLKAYEINKNIKIFTKFAPYIDYKKGYLHIIQIEEENKEFFLTAKLKSGLFDDLLLKIMENFNVTTILTNPEDEKVFNIMSCQALFLKLQLYRMIQNSKQDLLSQLSELLKENEEIFSYNNAKIDNCLIDSNNKEKQNYYNEYVKQQKTFFYDLNSGYNSSFIKLSNHELGKEFMITRYNYPDYFLVERKRPRYLIVNYLNSYIFMNFYFPYLYMNDKSEFLLLNFYAITLSNWFLWIILFVIIFFICLKISRDITKPLIKLKNAIEQMSFNDEKIFEYKDDDNINELFVMCKELVNKDEFKKSLKEKSFINDNSLLENKNYLVGNENEENNSGNRRGMTRNMIINNQIFEKNRKALNQETKTSFDKEIITYKDFKFLLKSRPRNQSRKRPKTLNKLITKNFDLDVPIKTLNRFQTKEDYNINSKIRDTFLRESIYSLNSIKKDNKISFNESKLNKDKSNKNDNELNILIYELFFCLGKNMFKPKDKDKDKDRDKTGKINKYNKSDKSLFSINDINSGFIDSTKNLRNYEDYANKFYNYADPILENNDNSDIIYEEIKSNSDIDRENKEKYLKEQYQINFNKNNLYYKYLKAKENWNNKFLKQFRNVHDLELDSNAMVELEDENNSSSLLPRKNLKKNELNSNRSDKNNILGRNQTINNLRNSSLKKSIIKNYNKNDKAKRPLRKSISMPINFGGKEITNPKQKKLGMRASVSINMKLPNNLNQFKEKPKKAKFNLEPK